jgi:copper(I)-binding protein
MKRVLLVLVLLILAGGVVTVLTMAGSSDLSVRDIWARAGAAGENSAIYFVIDNGLHEDDALLDVRCDAAEAAQLHLSKVDANGVMAMEHQERIPVPAGQKVEFKPGGLHVMLVGLKQDLKAGQKIHFTLVFEKAGEMALEAAVREP